MRLSTIPVALATITLLGTGCARSTPAPEPPIAPTPLSLNDTIATAPPPTAPPTNEAPPTPPPGPTTPTLAPRVIRVIAKRWEFLPSEIRVRKGERVVLEITSADVPHGIAIPEYDINRGIAPGVTERIEFTADKSGSFTAPCSVYCGSGHRDMRLTIVVE